MDILFTVATSTEGLNVPYIIRTTYGQWDDMVFGKRLLFTAHTATETEDTFQVIPVCFSMTTRSSALGSVTPSLQMRNISAVPSAIISMIDLLRFPCFSYPFIRCLFKKMQSLSPKDGIASLAAKMPLCSRVVRGFVWKQLPTIITFCKEIGAIGLTNLLPSFRASYMSLLKSFNHTCIIPHFNIYENPELLEVK